MILGSKIGIAAAAHSQDQASYFHVTVYSPAGAHADDLIHAKGIKQFVGIDAHRRDTHSASLY